MQKYKTHFLMLKNPFSLFDFLGYVFPGALAIFIMYFFCKIPDIQGLTSLYEIGKSIEIPFSLENTILLTLSSYVLGHLIAYLSSLTVEQFSIWLYGYPSDFLLNDIEAMHYWKVSNENSGLSKWHKYIWRIFIGLFLLPLTIGSLVFAKCFGVKFFFIKKLDNNLIRTIRKKWLELAMYLGYDTSIGNTDFHRVICHYEYEQQKLHAAKMDNYVALYGFLRAVTFTFNCLFLYLFFFIAIPTINISNNVDWRMIRLLVIMMFLSYLFFMAFMKFYRRYTLESFICLITDTSYYVAVSDVNATASSPNLSDTH